MGQKILIIDDSAMLRRIAASVLRAQPARYEVVAATRAVEGFAQACGAGANVVFADSRIAGSGDGGFCERLRKDPRTAQVPVVLLIGRDVETPELADLPENVVDTLRKPFAPDQLAGLVNTICGLFKAKLTLGEMRARLHRAVVPEERPDPPLAPEKRNAVVVKPKEASTPAPMPPRHEPIERESSVASFRTSKVNKAGSLLTVFREAAQNHSTGVLRFHGKGRHTTDVYFDDGRLVAVSSLDARHYSEGAEGVLSAKVSPATLEEAVDEQARTGVPFFLTLGSRGLLSKAAAVALLQRFGKQHFSRLWRLRPNAIEFEFEPMEALPGFALRLEPAGEQTEQWLLDTLRLLKPEDVAEDARHEGCVGTPLLPKADHELLKVLNLTDTELAFVRKVNGRHDLPTVAKLVGITTEAAYLMLYRFRCLEIMDYRTAPAPFVMTPRTSVRRVLPLKR